MRQRSPPAVASPEPPASLQPPAWKAAWLAAWQAAWLAAQASGLARRLSVRYSGLSPRSCSGKHGQKRRVRASAWRQQRLRAARRALQSQRRSAACCTRSTGRARTSSQTSSDATRDRRGESRQHDACPCMHLPAELGGGAETLGSCSFGHVLYSTPLHPAPTPRPPPPSPPAPVHATNLLLSGSRLLRGEACPESAKPAARRAGRCAVCGCICRLRGFGRRSVGCRGTFTA